VGAIGNFFGWLFSPIGTLFHFVFALPVFNVMMLIYQGVHSFGLSIILVTLLIRSCLIPLTRRQIQSSKKMQAVAPQLRALQAQYRGDSAGLMAAQQQLYRENGISMGGLGGCLPLLIQMPFLYAMFFSFEAILSTKGNVLNSINSQIYPFLPHLTQAPSLTFLGLSLITPNIALAIVAGLLTFIQMRMSLPVTAPTGNAQTDQMQQTQKSMQYIMPLVTVFIGWRYPAGLAIYWVVTTGFSCVQTYFINGWGSLWVGVPGMSHLVPAPKQPATVVDAAPARRSLSAPNTSSAALTAPTAGGGLFGGLRDWFRQIQEQAAAQASADRAAQARRADRNLDSAEDGAKQNGNDSSANENRVSDLTDASSETASSKTGASASRRSRPKSSGVTLVRPVANGSDNGYGAGDSEKRIAQQNEELPEKRIAHEASNNGSAKNNGSGRAYASAGSGANRKPSSQNGARGSQQGARSRNRGSR
jgi:YidC/Oxa1 family membrane protein insertase